MTVFKNTPEFSLCNNICSETCFNAVMLTSTSNVATHCSLSGMINTQIQAFFRLFRRLHLNSNRSLSYVSNLRSESRNRWMDGGVNYQKMKWKGRIELTDVRRIEQQLKRKYRGKRNNRHNVKIKREIRKLRKKIENIEYGNETCMEQKRRFSQRNARCHFNRGWWIWPLDDGLDWKKCRHWTRGSRTRVVSPWGLKSLIS